MKELQGAIIIGSVFQAFLGYSGLMSLLLRYAFSISHLNFLLISSPAFSVVKQDEFNLFLLVINEDLIIIIL